ncbi:hypothetical protein VPHD51_0021 [Vibrio phage D51]
MSNTNTFFGGGGTYKPEIEQNERDIASNTEAISVISKPNLLINGDMGIWQRGTDFTGASGYQTVDRWRHLSSNTHVQRWDYPTGASLAKYAASISGTGTYIGVEQRVEDAYKLIGQTVTLSFQADFDSSNSPYVYFAFHTDHATAVSDGLSVPIVPVDGYNRYTFTADLPDLHTPTPADEVFMKLQIVGAGAVSASVAFRLTAVKIELGSVATPFVADDPATSLAKCQRYFYRIGAGTTKYGSGYRIGEDNWRALVVYFPVTMRDSPSVTDATYLSSEAADVIDTAWEFGRFRWTNSTKTEVGLQRVSFDAEL